MTTTPISFKFDDVAYHSISSSYEAETYLVAWSSNTPKP